jgi:antitoxin (DNA-binding transcriptional repressor) of toxin-antitoxin stability system
MGVMSIREFNANTSKAFALVEAGETIKVTKNGKVIASVVPEYANRMDDPKFRAARERILERMDRGIPGLKGPFTYDERTER